MQNRKRSFKCPIVNEQSMFFVVGDLTVHSSHGPHPLLDPHVQDNGRRKLVRILVEPRRIEPNTGWFQRPGNFKLKHTKLTMLIIKSDITSEKCFNWLTLGELFRPGCDAQPGGNRGRNQRTIFACLAITKTRKHLPSIVRCTLSLITLWHSL